MGGDRAVVAGLGVRGRPRAGGRRDVLQVQGRDRVGDLPKRYGAWKAVCNRFWRWSRTGILSMLVAKVWVIAEAVDEPGREVSVDSLIVRAYQHAAGARRGHRAHRGRADRVAGTVNQTIMPAAGTGAG